MHRALGRLATLAATIVTTLPAYAQEPAPVCHSGLVNVERGMRTNAMNADATGSSLCLYEGPTAVHIEVRQTTIGAILSAIANTYQISYRSAVPLSELRSGRYAGPVRSVISEVLDGYDYAITHHYSHLDIIVFDKSGGRPVASTLAAEAPPPPVAGEARPPRSPVTVSRAH